MSNALNKYGIYVVVFTACLAGIAGLIVAGCCRSQPRYHIYMLNRTRRTFHDVAVYYHGRMAAAAGNLVNGGLASYGEVTLPIPAEVEVRWKDNAVQCSKKVTVKGLTPDNPIDWNIYYIIENDGSVATGAAPCDDRAANQRLQAGLRELRTPR